MRSADDDLGASTDVDAGGEEVGIGAYGTAIGGVEGAGGSIGLKGVDTYISIGIEELQLGECKVVEEVLIARRGVRAVVDFIDDQTDTSGCSGQRDER